jgi:hypothetical protein
VYAADAPELQLRALADLAYLVQVGALIDTPTPLRSGGKKQCRRVSCTNGRMGTADTQIALTFGEGFL